MEGGRKGGREGGEGRKGGRGGEGRGGEGRGGEGDERRAQVYRCSMIEISLYITGKSHCYSLGMVKIEASDDSHFMHQTVRVCHTDHPDSIVSSMACTVDLKN